MISFAKKSHTGALKSLWKECFGDSDDYIGMVFQKLLKPENILLHLDESGAVQAMLCVEYMDVVCGRRQVLPGAYVYAVATSPYHRSKGLSTALLEWLHLYLANAGICCSILVPASLPLFDFYGRRGYEHFSSMKKAHIAASDISAAPGRGALIPTGLERLDRVRSDYFTGEGPYVRWHGDYLRYISQECRFGGGEVLRYTGGGQNGYAVCYRYESGVIIKELAATDTILDEFLGAIHTRLKADSYTICLREDKSINFPAAVLPFSLIRWYDKEIKGEVQSLTGAAYISHVLD